MEILWSRIALILLTAFVLRGILKAVIVRLERRMPATVKGEVGPNT
jgi:hypothetical protein